MKTKLIEDDEFRRLIELGNGERVELVSDDEVTNITVCNAEKSLIGEFQYLPIELNDRGDSVLLICSILLEKQGGRYRRQGIGEAILEMTHALTDLPIVARCPYSPEKDSWGSELIGDGPGFVIGMRAKGLIQEACWEPCYCCPPQEEEDLA